MKAVVILLGFVVLTGSPLPARAADSKVKAPTRQVETGAKKIGDGKIGEGVKEPQRNRVAGAVASR